jgi:hypothetical protein
MKRFLLLITLAFGFTNFLSAQDFTGQWKGQFTDNSTSFMGWGGDKCEYVLELECDGNEVNGFSYTYFNEGGRRYYTICKLKGKLNKKSQYVEVTEIERTKTNVPVNIRNCFQIHKLTFFKQGDVQTLEGSWLPAPNQEGDCGFGTTVLSRRVLKKNIPAFNNTTARNVKKKDDPAVKFADKNKTAPPVAKKTPPPAVNPPVAKNTPNTKNNPAVKTVPQQKAQPQAKESADVVKTNPAIRQTPNMGFDKRDAKVLKTIQIENETFRVDLYDNGDIDGDTISLFFNGKLLLSQKRLTDKAITLNLNADGGRDVNELVMYAENLGSIPPNTAVMIVTDGEKRYEVRITSDLEKSGVIHFVHKPRGTQ